MPRLARTRAGQSSVNVFFAVNAVNKFNMLMNGNLINERKKPRTELKFQLLVKNEQLLIGPVRYVKRERTDKIHCHQLPWWQVI